MTGETIRPLFTWRSGIVSSELPAMTKYVALVLALHMNEMGGSCYPSANRLARESSLNVSTVWASLKKLQDEGWLVVVERGGKKGEKRRANVYQAQIPIAQDEWSDATYRSDRATPIAEGDTSTSLSTPITNCAAPLGHSDGSLTTIGSELTDEEREQAKRHAREALKALPSRAESA